MSGEIDIADNSKQFNIEVITDSNYVMHVESVEMSLLERKVGKTVFVRAKATVTVLNISREPVGGATVDGHWGGATTNVSSGVTDASGSAILLSNEVKNPANGTIFTFWVDNVTKTGWVYDRPDDPLVKSITYLKLAPKLIVEYETALGNAYPSPSNPDVWIPFALSDTQHVFINIYNASGRLVRSLDLGEKPSGAYLNKDKAAYWDGKNEVGESVSSGVYFYTIQAGEYVATKKMIIQK